MGHNVVRLRILAHVVAIVLLAACGSTSTAARQSPSASPSGAASGSPSAGPTGSPSPQPSPTPSFGVLVTQGTADT
jgi:uncharacterized lipoprotein